MSLAQTSGLVAVLTLGVIDVSLLLLEILARNDARNEDVDLVGDRFPLSELARKHGVLRQLHLASARCP
jgi:hypothetical protein